jgi:hypothetical protein
MKRKYAGRKVNTVSDISVKELEQLYDEIDADIKKNGLPTEDELGAEIEELNDTAAMEKQDRMRNRRGRVKYE